MPAPMIVFDDKPVVFGWDSGCLTPAHGYLLPTVQRILATKVAAVPCRIFDLGCGNGAVAAILVTAGYEVIGVDIAADGIAIARREYPHLRLEHGSAYEDLYARFGSFDVVLSLEVIEHLYYPHRFTSTAFSLLRDGGHLILSTPYHGYWKNLALALGGAWDRHLHPLQDHGHIKFWSCGTLDELLTRAGFTAIEFQRVGRIPALAKSVVAIATRPLRGASPAPRDFRDSH